MRRVQVVPAPNGHCSSIGWPRTPATNVNKSFPETIQMLSLYIDLTIACSVSAIEKISNSLMESNQLWL